MTDAILNRMAPLSEGWVKKMQRVIEQMSREQNVGGVKYFADEYKLIPGRTLSEDERQAEAVELYGPKQNTMLEGSQPR